MRTLTFMLAFFIAWPLFAKDVYKWTSEEGETIYSDTFRPDAERVRVRSDKSAPNQGDDGQGQTASTAAGGYENFEILTPKNNETVRSDEGVVAVGLSLSPALAEGHAIQVLVDGNKLEGELKSTQFSLSHLNLGTHSLSAKIVDAKGNLVMSAPGISFHLRKSAIPKL